MDFIKIYIYAVKHVNTATCKIEIVILLQPQWYC